MPSPGALDALRAQHPNGDRANALQLSGLAEAGGGCLCGIRHQLRLADNEGIAQRVGGVSCLRTAPPHAGWWDRMWTPKGRNPEPAPHTQFCSRASAGLLQTALGCSLVFEASFCWEIFQPHVPCIPLHVAEQR